MNTNFNLIKKEPAYPFNFTLCTEWFELKWQKKLLKIQPKIIKIKSHGRKKL